MKGYIIKYQYDLVTVTNDKVKWLEENNKRRLADGEDEETEYTFNIEEIDMDIYEDKK